VSSYTYALFIFPETRVIGQHFLLPKVWVNLHSFSRCCLPKMRIGAKVRENWTYSSSRSSKVNNFGTNRKRIIRLPINSTQLNFIIKQARGPKKVINSSPILHRFW